MRDFKRNSRSERSRDFSKGRGRDSGRPSMHQTTCDHCGKECEVPFKPTSGKPIFCSNCFDKNQNDGPKRYGNERSDRKFQSRDSRKRSFDDRDSVRFDTVCDKCGKDCEVPFRPTKGKPIYCDDCFGSNKEKDTDHLKKDIENLNTKLDKILEILMSDRSVENDQMD